VVAHYRFSARFLAHLLRLALVVAALALAVLIVLAWWLGWPADAVMAGAAVLLAAVAGIAWAALRRGYAVALTDHGYRVRHVRGAGVREARWTEVEDAVATMVAGERSVVLRLRDGRTTTIPAGLLAGVPDDFVRDLRQHLQDGQGYRRVG
jgi:hypothetical protein